MRSMLSMSAALVTCWAATAIAAPQQQTDRETQVKQQREAEAEQTQRGPAEVGRVDEKTKRSTVRASQVIGMEIQNPQGKDIGDVEDLVLDADSGKIRYAAVSYGGFLGLGDKLFAVPWEAFQAKPEGGSQGGQNVGRQNDYVLVLDVTEQELENAQGFSEDNWPDFGDRQFTERIDRRYGVQRDQQRTDKQRREQQGEQRNEQEGDVSVEVGRDQGVGVDVDDRGN